MLPNSDKVLGGGLQPHVHVTDDADLTLRLPAASVAQLDGLKATSPSRATLAKQALAWYLELQPRRIAGIEAVEVGCPNLAGS